MPLITCPLLKKYFVRVSPEFCWGKENYLPTRGVCFLECPLIGERTVVLFTPNSRNLKPLKKWLVASIKNSLVKRKLRRAQGLFLAVA